MTKRITGRVCWYDKRDKFGILIDDNGNEYYFDSVELNSKERVTFIVNSDIEHVRCAKCVTKCETEVTND
jgi:hypothetical protein